MIYYNACDGSMESQDGVESLCKMRIWSNRYDHTTWAKESKTGNHYGQIYHEKTNKVHIHPGYGTYERN